MGKNRAVESMAPGEAAGLLRRFLRVPWGFWGQAAAVLCLLLVIATPLLFHAKPALINADESLYLSEAINIAKGKGLTYTSGENIHHRPPLFPALLAADFKLSGVSEGNAHWASKVFAVGAAFLLFLLGRELFGFWGGLAGAVIAQGSSYLSSLSTTLYLDTTETAFLLVCLLLLTRALRRPRLWAFAVSGAALGGAFLVKETSILWLPLPFVAWLSWREHRSKEVAQGAVAFAVAFAVVAGWWWAWVFAATGEVFLVGQLGSGEVALVLVAAGAAVAGLAVLLIGVRTHWLERSLTLAQASRYARTAEAMLPAVALLVMALWCLLFLAGIQGARAAVSADYWRSVPSYIGDRVAGNVDPFYVLLAGWVLVAWKALRGSKEDGILLYTLLLFSPVILSASHSNLQVRQLAPAVYLSYLALGRGLGLLIDEVRPLTMEPSSAVRMSAYGMAAGLAVMGGVFVIAQQRSFVHDNGRIDSQEVGVDNWSNPLVHSTARWIDENVPAGSHIMSSHLFHSQLYFLTGARFPIYQLPTVQVRIEPQADQPLRPIGTFYRFEDNRLPPPRSDERWMHLELIPSWNAWVALSEVDLLNDLRERNIDYLVITGEDRVFSSLSYRDYFLNNPAFTLVHDEGTGSIELLVFKVDRSKLVPVNDHLTVRSETFLALLVVVSRKAGVDRAVEVVRKISPAPVQISPVDQRTAEADGVIAQIYGQQ
jgi:4-amino-4-deoxy-L-arabinose transferase-like glycosyltransferase